MKRAVRGLVAVLLLSAPVLACGDDETGPEGVTIADLVGTWTATKVEFTSKVNPARKIDLKPYGLEATLVVSANGRYSLTSSFPGEPPEVEEGAFTVRGDTIYVDPDGPDTPEALPFTLVGDTLTVTSLEEGFDFDDDGIEEPSVLVMVFQRTSR